MNAARAAVALMYALGVASTCACILRAGLRALTAKFAMTAAERCATYSTAFFSLPILAVVVFARLFRGAEVSALSAPLAAATPVALPVLMRAATAVERVRMIVVLVWISGLVFGLARTAFRVRNAQRTLDAAAPCDDVILLDAAMSTASEMKMRCPRIRVSNDVASPAVAGALNPTLLLPGNITDIINATQARLIFAHELAHIARRDTLVNFAQVIVESAFFFCPFTRAISNELRAERELACDAMASAAMAASTQNAPIVLARALERLETTRATRRPGLALAADDEPLLRRVIALVKAEQSGNQATSLRPGLVVAGIAMMTLVATAAIPANAVDSTLGLAAPAAAFRQDINAQDDRGHFTLHVVAYRAVGATFDGTPFPASHIRQRGNAVRFTAPDGHTMFAVRLQPTGGMVWRSR